MRNISIVAPEDYIHLTAKFIHRFVNPKKIRHTQKKYLKLVDKVKHLNKFQCGGHIPCSILILVNFLMVKINRNDWFKVIILYRGMSKVWVVNWFFVLFSGTYGYNFRPDLKEFIKKISLSLNLIEVFIRIVLYLFQWSLLVFYFIKNYLKKPIILKIVLFWMCTICDVIIEQG